MLGKLRCVVMKINGQFFVLMAALCGVTLSSCVLQRQLLSADEAAVQELCKMGLVENAEEVNSKRLPSGATLLIDAAEKGDVVLVDTLLQAGANPDGRGYSINAVPLTRTQSEAVVKSLIGANADVNATDDTGTTPLSRALSTENRGGVELLLQAGASVVTAPPADSPLLAVRDVQMAARLVEMGADVNCASARGVTPLMRAVARDDKALVRFYLEHGADAKAVDAAGNTALHSARSADVVKLLCEAGADATAVNAKGETALFDILHTPETVQALVTAGVPLDVISTETGMTALLAMLADDREDDAAILTLIRAGADVQVRTPKGETALQLAQQRKSKRRVAIIRALMGRGMR